MAIQGFSGRRLQGLARVLQAFGSVGCYSYLRNESYNTGYSYSFTEIQNTVDAYDGNVCFVNWDYRNSTDFAVGGLHVYVQEISGSFIGGINIGEPENLPLVPAPLYPALIRGSGTEYLSVARHVAADDSGIYIVSIQDTPTQTYVQLSTFNHDFTYNADSGQTTYDASASDAQRNPESIDAADGLLYTVSRDGYVYVYDFATLTTQDSWIVPDGTTSNRHSISVWDDKVYVMQTESSDSPKYCKVYVYDLDGTAYDDFEIQRNAYGEFFVGYHFSMTVHSGVIYSSQSGYQQQNTTDGTFICSTQNTVANNLFGNICSYHNGEIFLHNGKVITP